MWEKVRLDRLDTLRKKSETQSLKMYPLQTPEPGFLRPWLCISQNFLAPLFLHFDVED